MVWQVLGQLVENHSGGIRAMPRLFRRECFTARVVEAPARLPETMDHFRRSGVGPPAKKKLWDAWELSEKWMHAGFFDAFVLDFSEQVASALGHRVSASRTAANRGNPVMRGPMRNLRCCALPSCEALQMERVQAGGPKLLTCSKCRGAFYCSKEHQVLDWKRHKKECAKIANA